MAEINEPEGIAIEVSAIVGLATRQPLVKINFGSEEELLSVTEARELAQSLLECAEAAECDGFIVDFCKNKIGIEDDRDVAVLLKQFRDYRQMCRFIGDNASIESTDGTKD